MTKDDHYRAYKLAQLEEEVAADAWTIRNAELREADHHRLEARDWVRRSYWGAVADRVRRGERLKTAREAEAVVRGGPLAVVYVHGMPHTCRDLDYWG